MIGIKTKLTDNSLKIYGNPNLNLNKNYEIKNYLKDHRIMAMCTIAALTLGGKWKIYDKINKTSFPSFLKILKKILKENLNEKKKLITVAIDSPAAAGAGTQAKLIAKHYNLLHLDTGRIYRFIG